MKKEAKTQITLKTISIRIEENLQSNTNELKQADLSFCNEVRKDSYACTSLISSSGITNTRIVIAGDSNSQLSTSIRKDHTLYELMTLRNVHLRSLLCLYQA